LLVNVAQGNQSIDAVSSDLSMVGMQLRVAHPINNKEPLMMSISMPSDDLEQYSKQTPLQVTGKIVWQKKDGDKNFCGVEFANMNEASRKALKKCFDFYS
jgi:c-di-GMP-binding flagellar brake protein YcgR